jgi:hypothetical protein
VFIPSSAVVLSSTWSVFWGFIQYKSNIMYFLPLGVGVKHRRYIDPLGVNVATCLRLKKVNRQVAIRGTFRLRESIGVLRSLAGRLLSHIPTLLIRADWGFQNAMHPKLGKFSLNINLVLHDKWAFKTHFSTYIRVR